MRISRRGFVSSGLAAGVCRPALAVEPFKIDVHEVRDVEYKWQRRAMAYETAEPAGTIIVDSRNCFLYHILGGGQAMRYGVSVGKSTKAWTGVVTINRMAEWPVWIPAPYHLQVKPALAKYLPFGMPGGLDNPLGARAMYLYLGAVDTINRIHGGAKPADIGNKHTAGCIGMLNADVIDLYARVQVGTRVVMLG